MVFRNKFYLTKQWKKPCQISTVSNRKEDMSVKFGKDASRVLYERNRKDLFLYLSRLGVIAENLATSLTRVSEDFQKRGILRRTL